jgi:hypothetical protein
MHQKGGQGEQGEQRKRTVMRQTRGSCWERSCPYTISDGRQMVTGVKDKVSHFSNTAPNSGPLNSRTPEHELYMLALPIIGHNSFYCILVMFFLYS